MFVSYENYSEFWVSVSLLLKDYAKWRHICLLFILYINIHKQRALTACNTNLDFIIRLGSVYFPPKPTNKRCSAYERQE
jgi:hypothetical protein